MTPPDRRDIVDYLAAATDRELDALLNEARPDPTNDLDKGRQWYHARHGKKTQ